MTYLAIFALILVAFALAAWPLVVSGSPWDDLISQRDASYQAIQELEFEHQLGNLSERDYESLRARYRTQGAAVLERLDAAVKAAGGSETSRSGPANSATAAPPVRHPEGQSCKSCGQPVETTDRYCWSCRAQLGGHCRNCGRSVEAGDRFCIGCGTAVRAAA
jgi:hypothetical protein